MSALLGGDPDEVPPASRPPGWSPRTATAPVRSWPRDANELAGWPRTRRRRAGTPARGRRRVPHRDMASGRGGAARLRRRAGRRRPPLDVALERRRRGGARRRADRPARPAGDPPVRWDLCMADVPRARRHAVIELAPAGALTGIAKRELTGAELVARQDAGRPRRGRRGRSIVHEHSPRFSGPAGARASSASATTGPAVVVTNARPDRPRRRHGRRMDPSAGRHRRTALGRAGRDRRRHGRAGRRQGPGRERRRGRRHRPRHRRDLHDADAGAGGRAEARHRLGIDAPGAFDINAGCSGFCYALDAASAAVRAGQAAHVLVVGAERFSGWLDMADRTHLHHPRRRRRRGRGRPVRERRASARSCGAATARSSTPSRIDEERPVLPRRRARPSSAGPPARWRRSRWRPAAAPASRPRTSPPSSRTRPTCASSRRSPALGLPNAVVARDIVTSGNTSAATIPLALSRMVERGEIASGAPVLLLGFGAGLAYAGQVVARPVTSIPSIRTITATPKGHRTPVATTGRDPRRARQDPQRGRRHRGRRRPATRRASSTTSTSTRCPWSRSRWPPRRSSASRSPTTSCRSSRPSVTPWSTSRRTRV